MRVLFVIFWERYSYSRVLQLPLISGASRCTAKMRSTLHIALLMVIRPVASTLLSFSGGVSCVIYYNRTIELLYKGILAVDDDAFH